MTKPPINTKSDPVKIAVSKAGPGQKFELYVQWLKRANPGVICMDMYPMTTEESLQQLKQCSGLLLTGGRDVFPGFYGQNAEESRCGPFDIPRDRLELALAREAIASGMPVMAICRGIQLLNVALGGDLIIDIPSDRPSDIIHNGNDKRPVRHPITMVQNSVLQHITNAESGEVNSFHHQGVNILADPLMAIAHSADGIIEAFSWKEPEGKPFLLGVQWHPERMDFEDTFSGRLAHRFIAEAGRYRH